MKTINYNGIRYKIVRIDKDGILVNLPEYECYGSVSRKVIPFHELSPPQLERLEQLERLKINRKPSTHPRRGSTPRVKKSTTPLPTKHKRDEYGRPWRDEVKSMLKQYRDTVAQNKLDLKLAVLNKEFDIALKSQTIIEKTKVMIEDLEWLLDECV